MSHDGRKPLSSEPFKSVRRALIIGAPTAPEELSFRGVMPVLSRTSKNGRTLTGGDLTELARLAEEGAVFEAVGIFRPVVPESVGGITGETVFAEALYRVLSPSGIVVLVSSPRPALVSRLQVVTSNAAETWALRPASVAACACNKRRR